MVCIQVSLCELPVLLIDCQATGANPVKGHLLEIGWMETRAIDITQNDSKRISTENHLVRQPELAVIPARIGKITGIKDTDFEKAEDPQEITDLLVSKANQLLQKGRLDHCPTVIHFARYEKAFLHDLCGKYGYDPKLFNIICSHEISKRLLAGLPRRGLRALAGFIGISVPEARRTHHHLIATAHIWARMVRLLENEVGIQSLEDLQNWLKESVPPKVSKREFLLDSKIRLDLPDSPGVYRMLRSNGDILYIGKATSLKRRVNSYFHQRSGVADHILEMLTQAKDLRVTPTVTPLEAALLESDEIKTHAPPYNKQLKENDRELVFCSKDFSQIHSRPSPDCCLGPFPGPGLLESIKVLLTKNSTRISSQTEFSRILGFSESMIPAPDILSEGYRQFRDCRKRLFQAPLSWQNIRIVGNQLWKQRLEEQLLKAEEEKDEEVAEPKKKTEFVWTPERVTGFLDHLVLRVVHLSRRARWFCLLGESAICWSTHMEESVFRILVFSKGRITKAIPIEAKEAIDIKPDYRKSRVQRQVDLDLATYDRLSVLTTELRKLLTSGEKIEVILSSSTRLRNIQLNRILQWI